MADEKTPSQYWKHTPLPWRIGSDLRGGSETHHDIVGADGHHVVCSGHDYDEGGIISLRVDANLIVKAVNCHDELIAALRFCYATLSNVVHIEKRLQIEVDAIARARFALAKAEESTDGR